MGLFSHAVAVGIGYLLGSPQGRERVTELARRPEVVRLAERGKTVAVEQAGSVKQKVLARTKGDADAGPAGDSGAGVAVGSDDAGTRPRRGLRLPARLRRSPSVHFPASEGTVPPAALGGTTVMEDSEAALLGSATAPRTDPPASTTGS